MVKVSMRKAERILLMASILVLSLGTANASLWHRAKKTEAPAQQPAAAAAAMSLDAIEGIEVFRGLSELPSEFAAPDLRCGAIAIWTRRG